MFSKFFNYGKRKSFYQDCIKRNEAKNWATMHEYEAINFLCVASVNYSLNVLVPTHFAGHINFQLAGLQNRPFVMYPIGNVRIED